MHASLGFMVYSNHTCPWIQPLELGGPAYHALIYYLLLNCLHLFMLQVTKAKLNVKAVKA